MMQASGEGEASSLKMRAISSAITLGTQFENKFSTDYLWQKTRLDHPHLIFPAKAIDNVDRRVDWLTYQNITNWNIAAKNFLISIGMGTEDQGLIRKCFVCFLFLFAGNSTNCLFVCFIADAVKSKMGLVHKDNVDWFLTLDDTHREFLTVGMRGGASAGRYINPSFPRLGERCIVSTFHMTGVYSTTLRGKPLIPLYILSTGSLREDDYRIDSRFCEGLPTVVAAYGADKEACYSPAICVHHKGSMDMGLWHQLIRDVYTPCFEGRISPEPIRNPLTNKLISGPLIIKTDAGPGSLSKEASSIKFRKQMAAKCVHILLSLLNATACTAEMDQLFERFKPACGKSALCVASKKMQKRMEVRMLNGAPNDKDGDAVIDIDASDASSEDEEEPDEIEDRPKKKGEQSICNVSFSNFDLANIVNEWPEDPLELRPFDYHFTKKSIIRSWIAVGFLPKMEMATKDPKVRHELGEGGAPPAAAKRLAVLNKEYKIAAKTDGDGYNGTMLDFELPKVKKKPVFRDEETRIQHIVDNKLLNKAGGLYKTGLIVANCRVVVEAGKRMAESGVVTLAGVVQAWVGHKVTFLTLP